MVTRVPSRIRAVVRRVAGRWSRAFGPLRRWPMATPMATVLAISVMLCLRRPFEWPGAASAGLFVKWWPLILLLLAWQLGWSVASGHHRTGHHSESLAGGLAWIVGCLLICAIQFDASDVDRRWPWCLFAVATVAGAFAMAGRPLFAVLGIWRRWSRLHDDIVTSLREDLRSGDFLTAAIEDLRRHHAADSPRPVFRRWPGDDRSAWGDRHCLTLVEGHYVEVRRAVTFEVRAERNRVASPLIHRARDEMRLKDRMSRLNVFLQAGETLIAYLARSWPAEVFQREEIRWRIAEIRLEMIVVTLRIIKQAFARYETTADGVRPGTFVPDDRTQPYLDRAAFWLRGGTNPSPGTLTSQDVAATAFVEQFPPGSDAARDTFRDLTAGLLGFLFHRGQEGTGPDEVRALITRFFREFPILGNPPGDPAAARRQIMCAAVCLIALRGPESDLQLEVSNRLRTYYPAALDFDQVFPTDHPLRILAALSQFEAYSSSSARTPTPWNVGLKRLGRRSLRMALEGAQDGDRPGTRSGWDDAVARSRRQPGWASRRVWSARRGRRLRCALSPVAAGAAGLLLVAVNPSLPGNWGWNTVDHVADLAPGPLPAVAVSGERVAAIDGTSSIHLLEVETRTRRVLAAGASPVRDITAGPVPGSFLAASDHAIEILDPSSSVPRAPWLPAPQQSVWPGAPLPRDAVPEVITSGIDHLGWTLMIRGRGVARYDSNGPLTAIGAGGRLRSWTVTDLSRVPLERGAIGVDWVWGSLAGGGLFRARRSDLVEVGPRVITPPIVRLEADPRTDAAVAWDDRGGLWVCPSSGAPSGWLGPFGGGPGDLSGVRPLASLGDVTSARLLGDVALFGTSYGLFAHDQDRRRVDPVVPGAAVAGILPLPAAVDGGTAPETALAFGAGGLHRVHRAEGGVLVGTTIEQGPVLSAAVGPGEAWYLYLTGSGTAAGAVRVLRGPVADPSAAPEPQTIIPEQGWKPLDRAPEVIGAAADGPAFLFATAGQGAFAYDPDAHLYADRSEARGAPDEGPLRVESFSRLQGIDGQIVGLASVRSSNPQSPDAPLRPVLYQAGRPEGGRWTAFSPSDGLTHVTLCGPTLFDLRADGRLRAHANVTSADVYAEGRFEARSTSPEPAGAFVGDASRHKDGHWSAAFLLKDGQLVSYDSRTAHLRRQLGAPGDAPGDPRPEQVRVAGEATLLRFSDGRIRTAGGDVVFGGGTFPFPPAQARSMAAGTKPGELILGGPGGQVVRYEWTRGRCSPVGEPLPRAEDVIDVAATDTGAVYASTRSGEVYEWADGPWKAVAGARLLATGRGPGAFTWFAGPDGLTRLAPAKGQEKGQAEEFGRGRGMCSMVRRAVFAWVLDAQRIAFLTPDGTLGIDDARTESWTTSKIDLSDIRQCVAWGNRIVAVTGDRVVSIDPKGRPDASPDVVPIDTLPAGAKSPALTVRDDVLRVAFVVGGQVTEWEYGGGDRQVRRTGRPPETFDPSQIVLAFPTDQRRLALADRVGNVAAYDPDHRDWQTLRTGMAGDAVAGAVLGSRPGPAILVVATAQGGSRVEPIPGGEAIELGIAPRRLGDALKDAAREAGDRNQAGGLPGPLTAAVARWLEGAAGRWTPTGAATGDGEIGSSARVQIRRHEGRTEVVALRDGRAVSLRPGSSGFEGDPFTDVGYTEDGRLWALREGGSCLSELIPDRPGSLVPGAVAPLPKPAQGLATTLAGSLSLPTTDGRPRFLAPGPDGTLVESTGPRTRVLASRQVGDLRLEWIATDGNGIDGRWAAAGAGAVGTRSVWAADKDRLALRAVRDLAVGPNGAIVLLTELGVIECNRNPFAVRLVRPLEGGLTLVPVDEGVAVLDKARPTHLFDGRTLAPLDPARAASLAATVRSGPWLWSLSLPAGAVPKCAIQGANPPRPRAVSEVAPGRWAFRDDVVTWIGKASDGTMVWLGTRDGLWPFDPDRGRPETPTPPLLAGEEITALRCPDGPTWWRKTAGSPWRPFPRPGDPHALVPGPVARPTGIETEIRTGAFRLECGDGRIRFEPVDGPGRSAFADGRFFFDAMTAIAGDRDGLYALAAGRCLIRREPTDPGRVTGCWPLPPDVAGARGLDLSCEDGRRVLWAQSASGRTWSCWSFRPAPAGKMLWETLGTDFPRAIGFGPFRWVRTSAAEPLEPIVLTRPGDLPELAENGTRPFPLIDWWQRDRFAWDQVRQVMALDSRRCVLYTGLGPIVVRVAGDGPASTRTERGWLLPGGIRGAPALGPGGKQLGALVRGLDGGPIYLIRPGPDDVPRLERGPVTFTHRPVLRLRSDPPVPAARRRIGWREDWVADDLGSPSAGPAAESAISEKIPVKCLLRGGQFVFDLADSAAEIPLPDGPRWLTVSRIEADTDDSGLICVNALTFGRSDRHPRWELCDVFRAPSGLRHVRPGPLPAEVVGAIRSTDDATPWLLRRGTLGDNALLQDHHDDSPFRAGDRVTFRATGLSWTQEPWTVLEPFPVQALTLAPANYLLFISHADGLCLAFDLFQSVALDSRPGVSPLLAIGTQGGILLHPVAAQVGSPLAAPDLLIPPSPNISRVRFTSEGRLWMNTGSGAFLGWPRGVFSPCGSVPPPPPLFDAVSFSPNGRIMIRSQAVFSTNDAWWMGRSSFGRVGDTGHCPDRDFLWLGTTDGRLIRLTPPSP
jgi:hypothetical protein